MAAVEAVAQQRSARVATRRQPVRSSSASSSASACSSRSRRSASAPSGAAAARPSKALFGHGTIDEVRTVRDFELPRILIAWLAGGSLAIAGAVIQGVIRNPLAAPDVDRRHQGRRPRRRAPAARSTRAPRSRTCRSRRSPAASPRWRSSTCSPTRAGTTAVRLALVGIAVSALCESVIRYVMIDKQQAVGTALVWLTGSLAHVDMPAVWQFLPWVLCSSRSASSTRSSSTCSGSATTSPPGSASRSSGRGASRC